VSIPGSSRPGLQAELGLVPADLPLWYLPPIHAWQLPPQAYTGRQTGRVFVPRGNSPWEFVFDPYLAPYRTRRLYFPTGHHARIWHGQFKVNRPTRFLIVSREHAGGWTPEWEGAMRRTRNLKTLADAELRGGRPVQAALAYWQQTIRDPRDATAFLGLSDALLLLENYDWGGECAREGLRAEPRWLKARVDKRGFLDDPKPLEKAIAKPTGDQPEAIAALTQAGSESGARDCRDCSSGDRLGQDVHDGAARAVRAAAHPRARAQQDARGAALTRNLRTSFPRTPSSTSSATTTTTSPRPTSRAATPTSRRTPPSTTRSTACGTGGDPGSSCSPARRDRRGERLLRSTRLG
jgi:hypothetical protein